MNPHYPQSREESVLLLKLVIAEMSLHDAPFNPLTFAVLYEHLAGVNPPLSEALQAAREATPRLSSADIDELYRRYVGPADDRAVQAAQEDFQRLMRTVAASVASTGASAQAYGSQLAGLTRALESGGQTPDSATLGPRLSEVAGGTAHMQTVVQALKDTADRSEREIDRLRDALERSRIEACTDPLTRLLNRRGFDQAMNEVLTQPAPAGHTHCLTILDIDHFKRVNDTHGHPIGDAVIESIGKVLGHVARGPDVFAARIGGEEFAVLMRSTTAAHALQTAQAARSLVNTMKIKKRGTQEVIGRITVSAGVAAWMPGDDAARLMATADAALYRAKEAGRDRVVVA